jgi:hypothetical protein
MRTKVNTVWGYFEPGHRLLAAMVQRLICQGFGD